MNNSYEIVLKPAIEIWLFRQIKVSNKHCDIVS